MARDPMHMPPVPKGAALAGLTLELVQDADCCDGSLCQQLTIAIEDGGGGPFAVLSTERWALGPGDLRRLACLCNWACRQCSDEPRERASDASG